MSTVDMNEIANRIVALKADLDAYGLAAMNLEASVMSAPDAPPKLVNVVGDFRTFFYQARAALNQARIYALMAAPDATR